MKRLIAIIALLFAVSAFAQDKQFTVKVLEIQHRDPHSIADAVKMLGSGAAMAGLSVNGDLHTLTIRDYPENVAAIEQAVARLDRVPAAAPNIELRVSVLIASRTPLESNVPEDLEPVVKQLQSTLRYSHFALLATTVNEARADSNVEGSGFIDRPLFGGTSKSPTPYTYRLRRITTTEGEHPTIDVDLFSFSVSPVSLRPVGFETRVSIHPNEKVVIGTTTMGDRALIVVLNAKIE